MERITVVKIGGVVSRSSDVVEDLVSLQKLNKPVVLVHGGGNLITEWLTRQGVSARFVRGERVTDRQTLDVVIAVLAGLANKQVVAAINSAGGRAIGISGVDGGLVQGEIKDRELGYVGIVSRVDPAPLRALLQAGYIPAVSPVSLRLAPETEPQMININGDPVAGEIALAVGAAKLIFMTDIIGVCGKSGELIPSLSFSEAEALIGSGVASGGMIPKLKASLRAASGDCVTRIIDGRRPHALLKEIEGKAEGTTVHK